MNKTFLVRIQEIHCIEVEVEAQNGKEARQKAADMIENEEIDYEDLEYSHHVDQDAWPTEEISN